MSRSLHPQLLLHQTNAGVAATPAPQIRTEVEYW